MTSPLRTAAQFEPLESLRQRLAGLKPKKRDRIQSDNRSRYSAYLEALSPGAGLKEPLARIVQAATLGADLDTSLVQALGPSGGGMRDQPLAPLTPHHEPMPSAAVPDALDRLAQWTREEVFAELHPLERTALTLARIAEISPFTRDNLALAEIASCLWLLRDGFLLPLEDDTRTEKYLDCLDSAFCLEMQPLVERLVRGERRALAAALHI